MDVTIEAVDAPSVPYTFVASQDWLWEPSIPYYIIATFSEQIHNRWFVGDYHKNIQNNILTLERGDEHE